MNGDKIIVRLGGRLGNQMFQYAAARALAMRLDLPLGVEGLAPDSRHKSRVQILEAFRLDVPLHLMRKSRLEKWLLKLVRLGLPISLRGQRVFVEQGFRYDDRFELITGGTYLVGGWVSPRYFDAIRPQLLQDFSFKGRLGNSAAVTKASILSNPCSIAAHVRRGDYVSDPRTLERFGLCERDYYIAGIELFRKQYPDCHCYVFSDDVDMAQEELGDLQGMSFVRGNTQEEDLYLMSLCHHNIVANSTFSWWGAWLNEHPKKIVVAPKHWFGPKLADRYDTSDMIPAEWVRL